MEEEALIAAAKKGDRDAFNQLVERYQDVVYAVAYRVLSDPDAAADACQDAFLAAFRSLREYRGGSFRAWVARIVTNGCYDQLRARRRRPAVSYEETFVDAENPRDLVSPDELPEDFALRHEFQVLLQVGLQTLPDEQRIAVVLKDVEGLQYEEIAAAMRTSIGTVRSRISRGRGRLRDYLRAHQELLPGRYRLSE